MQMNLVMFLFGSVKLGAGLAAWVICAFAAAAPPDDAQGNGTAVQAKPVAPRQFTLGVGSAIRWGAQTIPLAKSLGVWGIRTDAPWKLIEVERGRYAIPAWLERWVDDALAAGLAPLLILDYGNPLYSVDKPRTPNEVEAFKRYAVFVMTHFKGRVRTYELWNEWNNKSGGTTPGDPESYVQFSKLVVPALRQADPHAIVIAQGVSPGGLRGGWLDKFLELGGAAPFDGVALHPYSWAWKQDRSPEAAMRLVDGYQRTAARHNGSKPVDFYITEMGWPNHDHALGESRDAVATFLSRFVLMAACRPYVRGVWWHTMIDDGSDRSASEHHYGLFDASKSPKPAASALRETARLLADTSFNCTQTMQGDDVTLQFRGSRNLQVRWTGGNIAPGGAKFQERQAERSAAGAGFAEGQDWPLFKPEVGDLNGVPRVLRLQP